jgi:hypothetical protein
MSKREEVVLRYKFAPPPYYKKEYEEFLNLKFII